MSKQTIGVAFYELSKRVGFARRQFPTRGGGEKCAAGFTSISKVVEGRRVQIDTNARGGAATGVPNKSLGPLARLTRQALLPCVRAPQPRRLRWLRRQEWRGCGYPWATRVATFKWSSPRFARVLSQRLLDVHHRSLCCPGCCPTPSSRAYEPAPPWQPQFFPWVQRYQTVGPSIFPKHQDHLLKFFKIGVSLFW